MTHPGLIGKVTVRRLRRRDPRKPILFLPVVRNVVVWGAFLASHIAQTPPLPPVWGAAAIALSICDAAITLSVRDLWYGLGFAGCNLYDVAFAVAEAVVALLRENVCVNKEKNGMEWKGRWKGCWDGLYYSQERRWRQRSR